MSHKQNKTLKIENIIDTQLTVLGNDISGLLALSEVPIDDKQSVVCTSTNKQLQFTCFHIVKNTNMTDISVLISKTSQ